MSFKYKKLNELKAIGHFRKNYPHGKRNKPQYTIVHKGCGGLLQEEKKITLIE